MTNTTEKISYFAEYEAAAREAALKGCPELTFTRDEYNDTARPDVELIAHHANHQALVIIFYADPTAVYSVRVIEGEHDRMFGHVEVNVDDGWAFMDIEGAAEHITEKAEQMKSGTWSDWPEDD